MIALNLYRFFQKHRIILLLLVLASSAAMIYTSSRVKLEEDITKFIPSDPKTNAINFTLQNLKVKDKVIINVFLKDTSAIEPQVLMTCADQLVDTLKKTQSHYIRDLQYKISDNLMSQAYDRFYSNLPVFLEDQDYVRIGNFLQDDSLFLIVKNNYRALLSPSGVVLGRYIKADPLNLTPLALKKIENLRFDDNFEVNEGYIQTRDKKNLLLFITPNFTPSSYKENKKFFVSLKAMIAEYERSNPAIRIEYYGAAPVSTGNSDQVRHDTVLTSSIALTLIVVLLLLYFRRLPIILFILAPVAFGALFSLTILYFLKAEISAIAIGAGSIVLGIAINYSLHFFTHARHERSVENVIKDLTVPMLIGCATTVAAFLSLQFTKTQALHDFGLFAGFSLIGAVIFSIIVLPHLLQSKKERLPVHNQKFSKLEGLFDYRLDRNKPVVLIAVVLTIIFAIMAPRVTFESDMMKMNYQDAELTQAQHNLDRINRFSLKSVYVVSKGKDLESALRRNELASVKLQALLHAGTIGKLSSPGTVLISDSLQKLRITNWNNFWSKEKKDSLKNRLVRYGKFCGFRDDAFSVFFSQLDKQFQPVPLSELDSLKKLLVNDWVNETKDLTSLVNLVKIQDSDKQALYTAFQQDKDVLVFDKQYMTSLFVEVIRSDFNLILLVTALLVFVFMLLAHGRIELAVINFLPMFVSWIWILGIMALLGLKFNIINIIISTFIFGLGDDYSIFIMDGLAHEYKFGRKNLASYKTSIVLSALTNIIGIGVLIFAEHPALRSIAAITIIGMFTVLFISFIVQPLLYDFMILRRKKRKLLPYTAFNLLITAIGFLLFMLGSIMITLAGVVLFFLVPAPRTKKKLIFHYLLMYVSRMMIYVFFNVKKEIINPQKETLKKPAVIIANHQSHIDLAMMMMLHPKLIIFTNDWVWNNPFYGFIVKMADFYPASQGYENAIEKIRKLTELGYSVLIFPEGTRSVNGEILRFHKGAFYLAEQLQLDIQPILLHGTGDLVTKGDFHFKEGRLALEFLPRIAIDDLTYGAGYKERSKNIRAMMKTRYEILRSRQETVDYYRPKLIKNYIYKGPILEWYCRIKVKLEDNYRNFETYLPKKGKITDVGCGYGFLSHMLSFMSPEREITGIDYDEEKIGIAGNCVSISPAVKFVCGDVTQYEFERSDAFVISDVLHYLPVSEQSALIEKCAIKLNPGGVMIIRDADADKKNRHLGTRYTEFFSTNSGFNKTKESGLHFSSAQQIKNVLDKFKYLEYKIIDDTRLTSNITFVVTHNAPSLT